MTAATTSSTSTRTSGSPAAGPSPIAAVLRIARKDLKQALRNRSFLIMGIIAPLAIIAVFDVTMADVFSGTLNPHIRIVDEAGVGGDRLVAGLRRAGFTHVSTGTTEAKARKEVADGTTDAAVVLPAALRTTVAQPTTPATALVIVSADASLAPEVAASIAQTVTATTRALRAATTVLSADGTRTVPTVIPTGVGIHDVTAGSRTLTGASYFAATMSTYFLFFVVQSALSTVHQERRAETLTRIMAAPIPRWCALAGKAASSAATGAVSFGVLWLASKLMFDVRWGPPIGVIAIAGATIAAALGIAALVNTFTRTEEGAGQLTGILTTSFAFLGGAFIPLSTDGALGVISRISPFRWITTAFGQNAGVGSVADVALPVLVLLLFGLVPGAIAIARADRLVAR